MDTTINDIPVAQITPGSNDRKLFQNLDELAASIQTNGLAQPITVRPLSVDSYEIVAGERRFRAIRDILKWEAVPCIVRDLNDEQASSIMLVENTGRADLNPMDEAEAYQERINRFGWSTRKLAETAGVSEKRVRDRLSLLNLVPEIQQLARYNNIPLGHAVLLSKLDNNRQRIAIRYYNTRPNISLRQFQEEVVNRLFDDQCQENQGSLFNLGELMVANAFEEEIVPLVNRGKKAKTGAPTRKDIPPVRWNTKDSASDILDRYIADLLAQNFKTEAETLGMVYNTLISLNFMSVPASPHLSRTASPDAEALSHSTKIS